MNLLRSHDEWAPARGEVFTPDVLTETHPNGNLTDEADRGEDNHQLSYSIVEPPTVETPDGPRELLGYLPYIRKSEEVIGHVQELKHQLESRVSKTDSERLSWEKPLTKSQQQVIKYQVIQDYMQSGRREHPLVPDSIAEHMAPLLTDEKKVSMRYLAWLSNMMDHSYEELSDMIEKPEAPRNDPVLEVITSNTPEDNHNDSDPGTPNIRPQREVIYTGVPAAEGATRKNPNRLLQRVASRMQKLGRKAIEFASAKGARTETVSIQSHMERAEEASTDLPSTIDVENSPQINRPIIQTLGQMALNKASQLDQLIIIENRQMRLNSA